jgi:hypothetical protein
MNLRHLSVFHGIAFARHRLALHCGLQINSSEALKRAAMEGGGGWIF